MVGFSLDKAAVDRARFVGHPAAVNYCYIFRRKDRGDGRNRGTIHG